MITDDMPMIQTLAVLVSGIGSLNWGLTEIGGINLLLELGLTGDALTAGYLVVGIAGLITLIDMADSTTKAGVGETSPLQEG